jgi:hypothetical protein
MKELVEIIMKKIGITNCFTKAQKRIYERVKKLKEKKGKINEKNKIK